MNSVVASSRTPSAARPIFAVASALARSAASFNSLEHELGLGHRLAPGSDTHEFARVAVRAMGDPATTSDPDYAAGLVQEQWAALLETMAPTSVFASLSLVDVPPGESVPFRKPGAAHTLAGAWRAEGEPIRVGAITLASRKLEPKSLGVLATYSVEMLQRARSNVEAMVRQVMVRDTGESLDAAFLDAQPASAERPAGLQTFATGANTRPASGTTVDAITADLLDCSATMLAAHCGTQPQWAMSVLTLQALMLMRDATGALAFPTLSATPPTLLTYPVRTSPTAPMDVIFLVDGDQVARSGGDPKFDATQEAVLHEEDTTPLPIASPGAPATVAAPARSLFQTNAVATRAVWAIAWDVLVEGAVQTITGVAIAPARSATPVAQDAPTARRILRQSAGLSTGFVSPGDERTSRAVKELT